MITSPASRMTRAAIAACCLVLAWGCTAPPQRSHYILNYVPDPLAERTRQTPYPFTLRVRDFGIEDAYSRPQIVYRQSPFQLQYYFYRVWAVRPSRMITDLIVKHLTTVDLVSRVVRRYDEGVRPDYELTGMIEAIEEYNSDDIWFAHMAIRFKMTRLLDGVVLYNRQFAQRKRVFEKQPEFVVRELSLIMNFIMNQVAGDLDQLFAREYGLLDAAPTIPADPDSILDTPEVWR